MAIAASSFFPTVGGAEVTAHNLAKYLIDNGHQVVMFVAWNNWRKTRPHKSGFEYEILPLFPGQQRLMPRLGWPYQFVQDRYFSFFQRRFKFDLWQSFGAYPSGVSVGRFALPRNIPHVIRTVGYDIQKDPDVGYDIQKDPDVGYGYRFDPRIDNLIQDWAPRASKAISLSDSVIPDLRDVGVQDDRIQVIPCGVDQPRFESVVVDSAAIRSKYGIPLDKFTYITVGRNHPKKGFPVLLEAMAEMKRSGTLDDIHVAFVGDGMSNLKTRATDLGIDNHLTLIEELGLDPNDREYQIPGTPLVELYRSVDACVFPSLIETFAMINIEAMAAGIPVISTDAPGCIETIVDGVDGLIAKAGDPIDLARKMERLQSSADLRSTLSANGSATVRNSFSWDVVGRQFESLYLSLTESNTGRSR